MSLDDESLLSSAVAGDAEALTSLLGRYGGEARAAISGAIGQQWRSVIDEDDVMQVTYVEAFLQIKRFQPNGIASFRAWLKRIAEHNLQDAIKGLGRDKRPNPRNRVRAPAGHEESVMALYDVVGGDSVTPSRVARGKERIGIVEESIRRLPEDYRKVIELYELQGRSVEEVAEQLGRSSGAVFMLRARALDRLRALLPSVSSFLSSGA